MLNKKGAFVLFGSIFIIVLVITSLYYRYGSISITNSYLLACQDQNEAYQRLNCLKPYFQHLTHNYSAEFAISEAKKLQKSKFIDDCHLATHFIGGYNFEKNNYDPSKSFASCSLGCIEGCYHGVMEAYISRSNSLNDTLSQIPTLCQDISTDSLLKRQCLHGVGHGILRHEVITLLDSIKLCQEFKEPDSIDTCLGGVFMENMNSYMFSSEEMLTSDLPNICQPVIEQFSDLTSKCISSIGEGLMFYTGHDLERSEKLCGRLSEEYQNTCQDAARIEAQVNNKASIN